MFHYIQTLRRCALSSAEGPAQPTRAPTLRATWSVQLTDDIELGVERVKRRLLLVGLEALYDDLRGENGQWRSG